MLRALTLLLIVGQIWSTSGCALLLGPGPGNVCASPGSNSAILAGNGNTIENGAGNCAIVTGAGHRITSSATIFSGAVITSGAFNTITAGEATIAGGRNNVINGVAGSMLGGDTNVVDGSNAAVVGGTLNTASGSFSFAGGSGRHLNASALHAVAFGGQHGAATADFAMALGSFAKAMHSGSLVISAKNTLTNEVAADDDDSSMHCPSLGPNTIHLCSAQSEGVFVNGVSLLGVLSALENEVANLTEALANSTKEARDLRDVLDQVLIKVEGIRGECLTTPGTRLLQSVTSDCFGSGSNNNDQLLIAIAATLGAVFALFGAGFIGFRISVRMRASDGNSDLATK